MSEYYKGSFFTNMEKLYSKKYYTKHNSSQQNLQRILSHYITTYISQRCIQNEVNLKIIK